MSSHCLAAFLSRIQLKSGLSAPPTIDPLSVGRDWICEFLAKNDFLCKLLIGFDE